MVAFQKSGGVSEGTWRDDRRLSERSILRGRGIRKRARDRSLRGTGV